MIYFIDFINTCISIEKKNTTTEKINDLILLSMNCNTEDEIILCSIFTNQFINKNIKIGKKIIFSIIEIIFNINRETLFLLFKQFGDIEKLYLYLSKNNTKNLVDNIYSNCNQIKNISIKTIKNLIDNLSKIKGINSEFNKIN